MPKADKPKVGVVAGDLLQPRFLSLFEALSSEFDVCVYALHSEALVNQHGTGLRLRLFDVVADMPGYMRGLEEELIGCSAIIGLETSRLATFQAVRAARKFSVPLGVVVNEFSPYFYERYANIRAIQFDICNKADRFWATSSLALQNLKIDGISEHAISLIAPVVQHQKFRTSPGLRVKFRSYVGLADTDFVVLFLGDLESWSRSEELLRAAHLLLQKQIVPAKKTLKILLAGNGKAARDLKYKAHDLGMGRHVMFLHQDPEPFLADLYAASDVIYAPRMDHPEFHEDLPMHVLEAMASGVVPLVRAASIAADLVGDAGEIFRDDPYVHVAAGLQRLLLDPEHFSALREAGVRRIAEVNHPDAIRDQMVQDVWDLIKTHVSLKGVSAESPAQVITDATTLIAKGKERDALIIVEERLMHAHVSTHDHAELLCCKGEALYGLGNIEAANEALQESVRLNERNARALRGLGFVAWQGHANEDALVYFKRAQSLQDNDPQTMLGIGLVYRRLGLTDEAIFWLEKSLVHDNYPPTALAALAQVCAQVNRPGLGVRVLERAIDTVGEHRLLLMTLGQLYLNEGSTEKGHEMLRRAMSVAA